MPAPSRRVAREALAGCAMTRALGDLRAFLTKQIDVTVFDVALLDDQTLFDLINGDWAVEDGALLEAIADYYGHEVDQVFAPYDAARARSPTNAKCRRCGCTDDRACVGGCSWVLEDLCSRCAGERHR